MTTLQAHTQHSHAARVQSRIIQGAASLNLKDDDEDDDNNNRVDATAQDPSEIISHGKVVETVETEGGKRARVPGPGAYPGEAPYGAPISGFHGKATDIFEVVAYLPSGQPASERPEGFFPLVGLSGNDPEKRDNPAWSLYARLKPEIYKEVKDELRDIHTGATKRAVILVTGMRAESMAMFSLSQPHQIFAPSLWLAAAPIGIIQYPVPVVDEAQVKAMLLAERAKVHVEKVSPPKKKIPEQLSLTF